MIITKAAAAEEEEEEEEEEEIATLEKQIEQYQYLIEHDELISETIAETIEKNINEEG